MNFKNTAVVSIIGKQNVGKTTLIRALIPRLKERGHKVGTFKYNIRKLEIDHQHKDTYKYFQSGADTVAISSHDEIAIIKRVNRVPQIAEVIEKYFNDVSIVLVEGYREDSFPKIKIVELQEVPGIEKGSSDRELVLCKGDSNSSHFSESDVNKTTDFIENIISSNKYYTKKHLQNA
ncbi:MAG: molybdopterin-guanine dinucleotide biosynthesis protein B [Candidatus Scalindua sp.]|nr:molybdopterin-guanine dinucleotide biosynthesis protein B [Candidatus Scalindua sp.]